MQLLKNNLPNGSESGIFHESDFRSRWFSRFSATRKIKMKKFKNSWGNEIHSTSVGRFFSCMKNGKRNSSEHKAKLGLAE